MTCKILKRKHSFVSLRTASPRICFSNVIHEVYFAGYEWCWLDYRDGRIFIKPTNRRTKLSERNPILRACGNNGLNGTRFLRQNKIVVEGTTRYPAMWDHEAKELIVSLNEAEQQKWQVDGDTVAVIDPDDPNPEETKLRELWKNRGNDRIADTISKLRGQLQNGVSDIAQRAGIKLELGVLVNLYNERGAS